MPHLILEYSDNVADKSDLKKLLQKCNDFLAKTGYFKLDDIKSRAIRHDCYVIGDGDSSRAFVTVNLSILSGREPAVKKELSEGLLKTLREYCPQSLATKKTSLTVQISELDKESYARLTSY